MRFLAFLILGIGVYWSGWDGHDHFHNPNGAGEWRSVPRPLRRLLRRGNGPVVIHAVFWEIFGLLVVAGGLVDVAGLAGVEPWPTIVATSLWVSIGLMCVSWAAAVVRARR